MQDMIAANWPMPAAGVLAIVVIAVLLVAWLLLRRGSTRAAPRAHRPDVLDEGVGPAQRNQALIDSPALVPPIVPAPASVAMAGLGEAIAIGAQDIAEEAAAPAPTPEPAPKSGPDAPEEPDDLRRIKGLGPKLVTLLAELGVTRFAQIAAWDEADIDRIDAQLGTFAGRIRRDSWVEQAGYLASGDVTGFEARFGKV